MNKPTIDFEAYVQEIEAMDPEERSQGMIEFVYEWRIARRDRMVARCAAALVGAIGPGYEAGYVTDRAIALADTILGELPE